MRIFLIPLSITIFNPNIFGFLFSTKNRLNWGMKCEKSKFRKSYLGDILPSKIVHEYVVI